MEKKLDERFERVEKALAALVDSLTKYNPSEKLAADLVEADRELSVVLKELQTHQNNVAKIKKLQEETDALDSQTKNILQNLWDMRKELKSTPTTTYADSSSPRYAFTTAELLAYARRISPNTLPPPGITNGVDLSAPRSPSPNNLASQTPGANSSFVGTPAASTPAAGAPPTPLNGNVGTPQPQSQAQSQVQAQAQQQQQQQPSQQQQQTSTSIAHLPPHLAMQLNPNENPPFFPWPTIDKIRSGALMKYQDLVNRGIDPKNYDPEEEERRKKDEEQARKEAEERARQEREEHERRRREEVERMMREREAARQAEAAAAGGGGGGGGGGAGGGSISGPSAGAPPSVQRPAAKQFTFLDADDDDDDDEEE
ncbi:putative mediator of RNA polymerase II transcription subunit 4 [Cladorrhinum samala]|uniref:Mediator of RNA polymerase II transcription subunit 4 n=1 Tax=Cladorrhinum samala TaxID=585594 RepID=A0AAV9I0T8_9PEZI|nr:putative mediator of RNA polymerase II transcription subunit 4 [Cladorrhinum samala]